MRSSALVAFALAACGAPSSPKPVWPPPAAAPAAGSGSGSGSYHDPDGKRGALPSADDRRRELHALRDRFDRTYAHRADKLARAKLDEDALFAELEQRLVAATTWGRYDAALYDALARFHDGHLSYHPPATSAPARGYTGFRLGLTTVLANDHLLVASVDLGSDVALAGVGPGDEVLAIDGKPVADYLASEIAHTAWSRPESAKLRWVDTWTSVLYPKGDAPRARSVHIKLRGSGEKDIAITPHEAVKQKREAIETTQVGAIAVVRIHSLEGGRRRGKQVDEALAAVRPTASAIVIDLRGDRGGDIELVGSHVLGALAEGKVSLGTYRVLAAPETLAARPMWKDLTAGPDGFSAPQDYPTTGQPKGQGFHGPIAVVVDAGCVSTCELVAGALRGDLHATVVGETTGGSSGGPMPFELPVTHGSVAIPSWNMLAADGKPIESDGVVPDVIAVATPDALGASIDLPLQTAIDLVRARAATAKP